MSDGSEQPNRDELLVHVLGYMQFSSGRRDPKLYAAMNRLYELALSATSNPARPYIGMPAWLTIQLWLQDKLTILMQTHSGFSDSSQAVDVLSAVWLDLLPNFLDFHRDLLFHQEPEGLFNGFYIARAIETVLQLSNHLSGEERIAAAIKQLNDYVGYRPVAVLENDVSEPYPNEWVCPIPLYIREVGITAGPYQRIVTGAMEVLKRCDEAILRAASFDLDRVNEIAFDPRAYDFDHPVNRRPNYQFGTWDLQRIHPAGYYDRFIVQQYTLDALLARTTEPSDIPSDELMREAATVLAGTMLMASGITGDRPDAIDSTVTLASLMQPIASYRDAFYADALRQVAGEHARRLTVEQQVRRQPFGGARQHLNAYLFRSRSTQLTHVQLARLLARMGNADAAKLEADHVQIASARMVCRIDCLLVNGQNSLRSGEAHATVRMCRDIIDYLHRAIGCGALVDPWNILGFAGNYQFFPTGDAACEDHRVEVLGDLLTRICAFFSRLWREAAARADAALADEIKSLFSDLADWWRPFAADKIEGVEIINVDDAFQSAALVASALELWHAGGASVGDVRFWASHADLFDSPRAYALVLEALLERGDFVASQALLIHWLSESGRTGIRTGEASFAQIATTWFTRLYQDGGEGRRVEASRRWQLAKRFFELAEANAEAYWRPPEFALATPGNESPKNGRGSAERPGEPLGGPIELAGGQDQEDGDDSGEAFAAAYEDVVFQDSADDGQEGPVYDTGPDEGIEELQVELARLEEHLDFNAAIARMWKMNAVQCCIDARQAPEAADLAADRLASLRGWCDQAAMQLAATIALAHQVRQYVIKKGGTDRDSISIYDRKRVLKEVLMERAIAAAIEIADCRRLMLAAIMAGCGTDESSIDNTSDLAESDWDVITLYRDLLSGATDVSQNSFDKFIANLHTQRLLYVPLARNGDPIEIFRVRLRRRSLTHLLTWLPRRGMFDAACRLVETARRMEHRNPVGPGAVTEFDELFHIGFNSMTRSIVRNAYAQRSGGDCAELEDIVALETPEPPVSKLLTVCERLTEVLLFPWLQHSRTLRLSVLETIDSGEGSWDELSEFIKNYGGPLFNQSFLKLSNVRGILHRGVQAWLEQARTDRDSEELETLLAAIDSGTVSIETAARSISIVMETVMDHYAEYRDYNSTTTQSDRGEMIFMFLDFLRLRVKYDRVSWNLKPVFVAHEVLVRYGCTQTAQQWRRALAERVGKEANEYLAKLHQLQNRYAMQMPSVANRLAERFMKPMSIGRMRALVRPAMQQMSAIDRPASAAFELLLQEAHVNMRIPSGAGFEMPEWLAALHEEVVMVLEEDETVFQQMHLERAVPIRPLRTAEIETQLDAFERQCRTKKLP